MGPRSQNPAYLASTTVTDQDELESGWGLFSHGGLIEIKSGGDEKWPHWESADARWAKCW